MHTTETTNGKLEEAKGLLLTLMSWAKADAEHAFENDAPAIGRDDRRRYDRLTKAYNLLCDCERQ